MEQTALVVGGGVAGMRIALSLADRGVQVHLVERSDRLGGWAGRHVHGTLGGFDPSRLVNEMCGQIAGHPRVLLHLDAEVVESRGPAGGVNTLIRSHQGEELVIRHGATILCTGGREPDAPVGPSTAEHGGLEASFVGIAPQRVMLQSSLEAALARDSQSLGRAPVVVMIQCVGSRLEKGRNYCGRLCCALALKNALALKRRDPGARILILNRDLMAHGGHERHYTEAREQGILFAKYSLDRPPVVQGDGGRPVVKFVDPVLRRPVSVTADLLVLSTGVEPSETNARLGQIFDVSVNADGFFQEADAKWQPVELGRSGVFVAGMAHSPQLISEVLSQAEAAAQRAFAYLCRPEVLPGPDTATVRQALCSQCEQCVVACPYRARQVDASRGRVVVDGLACRGCGACAAACPNGAADVAGAGHKQMLAVVEAALEDLAP